MLRMLVHNRVKDYTSWRSVFDENAHSFDTSGLTLEWIRTNPDDPQDVWFSLLVEDRVQAEQYLADPIHAQIGEQAGVLDGRIIWLHDE